MTKVGICGTWHVALVVPKYTATLKTPSPHHNQVWAAGGAVIRPHLENAESQNCKAKRPSMAKLIHHRCLSDSLFLFPCTLSSSQHKELASAQLPQLKCRSWWKLPPRTLHLGSPAKERTDESQRFLLSPATDVAGE